MPHPKDKGYTKREIDFLNWERFLRYFPVATKYTTLSGGTEILIVPVSGTENAFSVA